MLRKFLVSVSACALFVTLCKVGELSETKFLYDFIHAVDPENVLGIELNGMLPHPCLYKLKGVKCNLRATAITEIRLENLNLSGKLDADSICEFPHLQVLSLAKNQIQGTIPDSISKCRNLRQLDLSSNSLNGSIPEALTKLKSLRRLNISRNHFTGDYSHFKQEYKLHRKYSLESSTFGANIIQKAARTVDVLTPLSESSTSDGPDSDHHKKHSNWITWVLVALGVTIFLLLVVFLIIKVAKSAKEKEILKPVAHSLVLSKEVKDIKPEERQSELVFFVKEEEKFELDDLLEATANLHSQGVRSSLYKVQLKNKAVFAVKRLKKLRVSFEEFSQTMRQIGNLKHQNILPLVGYHSTNEEKLLIYRYQNNGSLLTLLENYVEGKRNFPWDHRLSIAVGIARALDYIYQRSDHLEIIPHGNIKPSNILLNEDEEPLLSEYGYSKFLDHNRPCQLNSNGYTAPERRLNVKADVFSFGVILLELLTGKVVENSNLDLLKWVKSMVREEWTGEVFDKEVSRYEMYAFPLLNISLKCVARLPQERPTMAEVLEKIEEIVNAQEVLSPSSVSSNDSS